MKDIERIGKCKNIKEAKIFLMKEFGYTNSELAMFYDDNDIMKMIDDDNLLDSSQQIVVSAKSSDLSSESANFMDMVIERIKHTVNIHREYLRFYHILTGEIFHVNRKVMFGGRRYFVVFHDKISDKMYLTDSTRLVYVDRSDVKLINENILFEEIGGLFEETYKNMDGKINFANYLEIFSYIYDIEITVFISKLSPDMKKNLNRHLKNYLMKNGNKIF